MAAKSNPPQRVDIGFAKRHDVALSEAAQGEPSRATAYASATRRVEPLEAPTSCESWALRRCAQRSALAKATAERLKEARLRPERLGRRRKRLRDEAVGSSSLRGEVVFKRES